MIGYEEEVLKVARDEAKSAADKSKAEIDFRIHQKLRKSRIIQKKQRPPKLRPRMV